MLTPHRALRAMTFAGLCLILLTLLTASSAPASASTPDSSSLGHPYASLYQPILNAFLKKGHPGVSDHDMIPLNDVTLDTVEQVPSWSMGRDRCGFP
jgi:hypothetical protein